MSKHKKTLEKLCRKPTPSDISWKELVMVLEHFGYEEISGDGSRRKLIHRERNLIINCHKPHPGNIVKQYCLKNILDNLRLNRFL